MLGLNTMMESMHRLLSDQDGQTVEGGGESLASIANLTIATIIFIFVAFNFLFPVNKLLPLDRRTTSVCGALLVYITRTYYLHLVDDEYSSFMLEAIDFNVLVLLSSIMIINHLVVHLKETRGVIEYLQNLVKDDPTRGFWMVSLAAFLISPFLTNDGVCLLFVEPILNAFDETFKAEDAAAAAVADGSIPAPIEDACEQNEPTVSAPNDKKNTKLESDDCLYFLLALACSANIGSALTYTGNPQNMIVADDSIGVLPSYKFLLYMFVPAVTSWLITTMWIQRCWLNTKMSNLKAKQEASFIHSMTSTLYNPLSANGDLENSMRIDNEMTGAEKGIASKLSTANLAPASVVPDLNLTSCCVADASIDNVFSPQSPTKRGSALSPSPRKRRQKKESQAVNNLIHVVSSPFPYMVLILLGIMIIMIFVDIMPISSLICVFAMIMVVSVVIGNHWRNQKIWTVYNMDGTIPQTKAHSRQSSVTVFGTHTPSPAPSHPSTPLPSVYGNAAGSPFPPYEASMSLSKQNVPNGDSEDSGDDSAGLSSEDKVANLQEFFEELFSSLDYSLLIIFLGLFVVVANMETTGLPKYIWNHIVGAKPFKSFASIAGISVFILLASQLLGNVAVIQLAKPNVTYLDDESKRLAWAVISFVATVGGNLTITGSAANIIVAEKAARLDPNMSIDFFQHGRVCFGVTVLSCVIGGAMLAGISTLDNMLSA